MKTLALLGSALLLSTCTWACTKTTEDVGKAPASVVSETTTTSAAPSTRALTGFAAIRNEGVAKVDVTIGKAHSVSVSCEKGSPDDILTTVDGGALVLSAKPNSHGSCRIDVAMPSLAAIDDRGASGVTVRGKAALASVTTKGAGVIDVESSEAERITIKHEGASALRIHALTTKSMLLESNGAGSIELAGKADVVDAKSSGAGTLKAKDLVAETVTMHANGAGNAEIHATKKADVVLGGVASVKVYGHPAEHTEKVTGVGRVRFE